MTQKKKKKLGRGDSASPSRFASLSKDEMQQILTARKTFWWNQTNDKLVTNKWQTFKIVKYKTRAFYRKFEIKPISILLNISLNANNHFWYCCPFFASYLRHNFTGYVINELVHAFSGALSSYGALGKFGEHSR